MPWWEPGEFAQKRPHLERRAALIRAIRAFFEEKTFLEVETPALQVTPTADTHIHGFKTELLDVGLKPLRGLYLAASPEFAMKKLLVAGLPRIYQLCHGYRNGENTRLHTPEFTILEWYRADVGYREIMDDTVEMLRFCAEKLGLKAYSQGQKTADPYLNWNFISVVEAFDKYTNISINTCLDDTKVFSKVVEGEGIRVAPDDSWDDLFFRVMAEKIEPNLGIGAPAILYDYPVCMAALARKNPEDPRFAERFEVYVCGVELANGYGELSDFKEQKARFEADLALKKQIYGQEYPVDEDFLKALELGMPESGGIALGVDRLAMLATGAENIEQVLWAGRP